MNDVKTFLKDDGFTYSIEELENGNEALEIQQNDESGMQFISRITEKLLWSNDWKDRIECAKQDYGLDILINDEYPEVRRAVAKQNYGLDKLVNDADASVRAAVASQDYGLDALINDPSKFVHKAVAEQCYGLDKLVNDPDEYIHHTVEYYLKSHNLTIDEWAKRYPDRRVLL